MKTEICESIFASDFFRMHGVVWVQNEIEICARRRYENAYSFHPVQIYVDGREINEWMFDCFTAPIS